MIMTVNVDEKKVLENIVHSYSEDELFKLIVYISEVVCDEAFDSRVRTYLDEVKLWSTVTQITETDDTTFKEEDIDE